MRKFTFYLATLFIAVNNPVSAEQHDCVTLNQDVAHIEQLAKSGQYRKLTSSATSSKKPLSFDYQLSRSFDEYLKFAKQKIVNENPKAGLTCPIETGVTKALNKSVESLVVADLVAPFELTVTDNNKGVLLIHGLTDSPYLFHDLASFYYSQGFNVRTLLLPGHGTAPDALTDVEYQQWQIATEFAINKMQQDFKQVYLGGFSTGGALILDYLLTNSKKSVSFKAEQLKGVMLWAPASKAKSKFAWAAGVVDWLPFLDYTHKGADIDFAKYESFPLNAGAQVHALMNALTDKLVVNKNIPDIPLLTITSEVDSTIETQSTIELLTAWHNAPNRQSSALDELFYFGQPNSLSQLPKSYQRVLAQCDSTKHNYCSNIVNVAHTSVTNSPTNPHYGWQGSYRNCETTFGSEHYQSCKTTKQVTLGETTAENLTKYPNLQRLTFNPNFEQMTQVITEFIHKTQ